MSILTIILLWYLSGLISCLLGLYTDYHKGIPLYLSGLIGCLFIAMTGPIVLVVCISQFCADKIILQKKK